MARLGKARVLVVDGDEERLELVQRCLSQEFEIVKACPGPAATRLLETESFDMLLSEQPLSTHDFVASCPAMRELLVSVERIARAQGDVFLRGEAGTGKAFFSRALHRAAGREGDIVCLRLVDLQPGEMEVALFGRPMPAGGTLFLDGIELLPLALQERLVRERQSSQLPGSDCRLVCASVNELEHESIAPSLHQHLKPLQIGLPALRDRGEDIPRLAVHFVMESSRRLSRRGLSIGREAMAELCAHNWPGNVSELRNTLEQAVQRSTDETEISPRLLDGPGQSPIIEQVVDDIIRGCRGLDAAMGELEAAVIREALEQQCGNRSAAARQLKLPRQTLQDRMKKHGLWSS